MKENYQKILGVNGRSLGPNLAQKYKTLGKNCPETVNNKYSDLARVILITSMPQLCLRSLDSPQISAVRLRCERLSDMQRFAPAPVKWYGLWP